MAKTDKLDAQDVAHFGEALQPGLTIIKPDKLLDISDLITVRRQCLDMSTMQKNRLLRMPKSVQPPIQRILKAIQKEIERIDQKLDKLVDAIPQWQEQRDLLMSAKGVGKVVAYTLMSELPARWSGSLLSPLGPPQKGQLCHYSNGNFDGRFTRDIQAYRCVEFGDLCFRQIQLPQAFQALLGGAL